MTWYIGRKVRFFGTFNKQFVAYFPINEFSSFNYTVCAIKFATNSDTFGFKVCTDTY